MGQARLRRLRGAGPVTNEASPPPANVTVSRLILMKQVALDELEQEREAVNRITATESDLSTSERGQRFLTLTQFIGLCIQRGLEAIRAQREAYEKSQRLVVSPDEV